MSSSSSAICSVLLVVVLLSVAASAWGNGNDFYGDFDFTWGDGRARILDNGKVLTLSLDRASGSSIQSKKQFLFGRFDMQLKLVPGDSAGTVTSFYLSSHGSKHDEIDFEFLGNVSGEPYVLHTNIYTRGGGGREQQFYLWFDPTADFHNYSILWTPNHIILSVDGTPIRDFKNLESIGVPYPNKQAMRLYASIWNAEYWATRGGQVRTDWSKAPFVASYKNFHANACVWSEGKSSCNSSSSSSSSNSSASSSDHNNVDDWDAEEFDFIVQDSINWVQKNYMIYDYCSDLKKFPRGLPAECVVAVSNKHSTESI